MEDDTYKADNTSDTDVEDVVDDIELDPVEPDDIVEKQDVEADIDIEAEAEFDAETAPGIIDEREEGGAFELFEKLQPNDPGKIVEEFIPDRDDYRTSDKLSEYEQTAIISHRAEQIATFNNSTIDITGLSDAKQIAQRELMLRKNPFLLRREVGEVNGRRVVEVFDVNEMIFHYHYNI